MKQNKRLKPAAISIPSEKINEAAEAIALAFHTENFTRTLLNLENKRVLPYMIKAFELQIKTNILSGFPVWTVIKDNKVAGVAVIKPPGRRKISLHKTAHLLYRFIKILPIFRFMRIKNIPLLKSLSRKPSFVPEKHSTLDILAVNPSFQGQGVGRILFEKLKNDSFKKNNCSGIYLLTGNESNWKIYNHMGFKTILKRKKKNFTAYHMFLENENNKGDTNGH